MGFWQEIDYCRRNGPGCEAVFSTLSAALTYAPTFFLAIPDWLRNFCPPYTNMQPLAVWTRDENF